MVMLGLLYDANWRQAFGYAGEPDTDAHEPNVTVALGSSCSASAFTREDVESISYHRDGEHDETNWLMCGRLHDGRWFYLEAWCDYTGWDCVAGGSVVVADTWIDLVRYGLTDEARELWGLRGQFQT